MRFKINPRVVYTLFSALVIIVGSIFAIRFAQGYRLSRRGSVQGTGLLVANSFPAGAEVYVNGKLTTATDDTLYLDPGSYQVEIRRDGYTPWQKTVTIEQELVTQTNAQLYRVVPSLTPLSFTGVKNISTSPDGQKLLYYTSSASAQLKNGLYLLELGNGVLANQKEPRQIAEETPGFDLNTSTYIWSPDNTEVLLSSDGRDVLLDLNKKNVLSSLPDIAFKRKEVLSEWEAQLYDRERQFLGKFPDEFLNVATQSAQNLYLSPDKKKVMYVATASAILPPNLTPALPASSSQPEERTLKPGTLYIYDREEDKNFALRLVPTSTPSAKLSHKILLADDLSVKDAKKLESSPSAFQRLQASSSAQIAQNFASFYSSLYSTAIQWFPDSKHLLYTDSNKIYLVEYDNTNKTPVYAGPFLDNFVYPWPDGSKLIVLTTFSSTSPNNLYTIDLK